MPVELGWGGVGDQSCDQLSVLVHYIRGCGSARQSRVEDRQAELDQPENSHV